MLMMMVSADKGVGRDSGVGENYGDGSYCVDSDNGCKSAGSAA